MKTISFKTSHLQLEDIDVFVNFSSDRFSIEQPFFISNIEDLSENKFIQIQQAVDSAVLERVTNELHVALQIWAKEINTFRDNLFSLGSSGLNVSQTPPVHLSPGDHLFQQLIKNHCLLFAHIRIAECQRRLSMSKRIAHLVSSPPLPPTLEHISSIFDIFSLHFFPDHILSPSFTTSLPHSSQKPSHSKGSDRPPNSIPLTQLSKLEERDQKWLQYQSYREGYAHVQPVQSPYFDPSPPTLLHHPNTPSHIASILNGEQDTPLYEQFSIPVTRHALSTLLPLGWLNDEIINFAMELTNERTKHAVETLSTPLNTLPTLFSIPPDRNTLTISFSCPLQSSNDNLLFEVGQTVLRQVRFRGTSTLTAIDDDYFQPQPPRGVSVNPPMPTLVTPDTSLTEPSLSSPLPFHLWRDTPLPRVHIFNSFFFSKLTQQSDAGYDYASVRRWTRRVDLFGSTDISVPTASGSATVSVPLFDKLIVPVNRNKHWTLAVINLRMRRLEYFDSMGFPGVFVLAKLRRWMNDESMDKKKQPFDFTGWVEYRPQTMPRQHNGSDCGVYAMMMCEHITRQTTLSKDLPQITQTDMDNLRRVLISFHVGTVGMSDDDTVEEQQLSTTTVFDLSPYMSLDISTIFYFSPLYDTMNTVVPSKFSLSSSVFAHRCDIFLLTVLDEPLRKSVSEFTFLNYAKTHFTQHTRGFPKKNIPVEELVTHSKEQLKKPLIVMPQENHNSLKDTGQTIYLELLQFLGDVHSKQNKQDHLMNYINKIDKYPQFHTEALCELMKQITNNPSQEAALDAWKLFIIFLDFINPETDIIPHLINFIDSFMPRHQKEAEEGYIPQTPLELLTAYALAKVYTTVAIGGRYAPLSPLLTTLPSQTFLIPRNYGVALEDILLGQMLFTDQYQSAHPDDPIHIPNAAFTVPKILVWLCSKLDRPPGMDSSKVVELFQKPFNKFQLDLAVKPFDQNKFTNITSDFTFYSNSLKNWLRQLREPLIPQSFNERLVALSSTPAAVCECIETQLCALHFYTLKYLIGFIRGFIHHEDPIMFHRNIEQMAHFFIQVVFRFHISDSNPHMIFEKTKAMKEVFSALIVNLAISPDERAMFSAMDQSVRAEYNVAS
ncbi:putative Sentrin-specific protease 1 [Blattamonas nauphoetae]|uniref:Sentrin-specific protease 1 n=1 Tax=Blattamonas nauphoetae TaxID=2049346 RepID=A0ABQ9YKF4_9EUKA|nr:putative Sentrin-specific protease 1 [Blattamonas nauphoetae]